MCGVAMARGARPARGSGVGSPSNTSSSIGLATASALAPSTTSPRQALTSTASARSRRASTRWNVASSPSSQRYVQRHQVALARDLVERHEALPPSRCARGGSQRRAAESRRAHGSSRSMREPTLPTPTMPMRSRARSSRRAVQRQQRGGEPLHHRVGVRARRRGPGDAARLEPGSSRWSVPMVAVATKRTRLPSRSARPDLTVERMNRRSASRTLSRVSSRAGSVASSHERAERVLAVRGCCGRRRSEHGELHNMLEDAHAHAGEKFAPSTICRCRSSSSARRPSIASTTRPTRSSSARCSRSRPAAAPRTAPTARRARTTRPRSAPRSRSTSTRCSAPPRPRARPAPRASAWAPPGAR